MKNFKKTITLIISSITLSATTVNACGPFFPAAYIDEGITISDMGYIEKKPNEYSYSWSRELVYIVNEKFKNENFIVFKDSKLTTKQANAQDLKEKLSQKDSDTSITEFTLYQKGKEEMKVLNNPKITPPSWIKLMQLPEEKRKYRTTWVLYMLGNMSANAGDDQKALEYYQKLRDAVRHGYKDSLGLAHASYKREYCSVHNPEIQLNALMKAMYYYLQAKDESKINFLLKHSRSQIFKITKNEQVLKELLKNKQFRELITASYLKTYGVLPENEYQKQIQIILNSGDTEVAALFAWNFYHYGKMEKASELLKFADKDNLLTLWLKAKLAIYNGNDKEATTYLYKWLNICKKNKNELIKQARIAPGFNDLEKAEKDIYGILGNAIIYKKDFTFALQCFQNAEDWASSAEVAEKLMPINDLINYVDKVVPEYKKINYPETTTPKIFPTYSNMINYLESNTPYSTRLEFPIKQYSKNNLRYLLARRLMREGKYKMALKYMPPNLTNTMKKLITLNSQINNKDLPANERALAAYNLAKIMRWYGMSLSGTEFYPDYFFTNGTYDNAVIPNNWAKKRGLNAIVQIMEKNLPTYNIRFHYKFEAVDILNKCINLTDNRELKFFANLLAGDWLYMKYPKKADQYYKAVTLYKNNYIAQKMDKKHWFLKKEELPQSIQEQIYATKSFNSIEEVSKLYNTLNKNSN